MTPKFAVVGHPNKGKSSIVSTLAEDTSVAISRTPGTTTVARSFPLRIDGQLIYELIDTPGFQRPSEVLAWLVSHSKSVSDRADVVRRFVDEHQGDARFHDECELLSPLIEGAGILYVVDGSKPFGSEYETEMEILRWTGQPRMAVINLIGDDDHTEQWRRALDQYFSLVRVFDALHSDTETRLSLLRSFGQIHEPWRADIERAVDVIEMSHRRRLEASASCIAELLHHALTAQEKTSLAVGEETKDKQPGLEERLREGLRRKEELTHHELASIYRHTGSLVESAAVKALGLDPFSRESESLFGLTKMQLAASGAVSGGVAGTGIDVLLGGASLFTGAAIGALLGGASAVFGSKKAGKVTVLGQPLASRELVVGPFRDPNLPWVLLGRARLFCRLVAQRNHARRDAIVLSAKESELASVNIPDELRQTLNRYFADVRNDVNKLSSEQLGRWLTQLLAADIDEHQWQEP